MDKDKTLSLVLTLIFYYENYRYTHLEDWLSAEYVNHDVPIYEMKEHLKDYFVDVAWNFKKLWRQLNLVQKDFLLRSINGIRKISDVSVDPETQLVSLKYEFMCSVYELYHARDLLFDEDSSNYEELFPLINIKNLEKEIDHIELILHNLTNICPIKYAEETEN